MYLIITIHILTLRIIDRNIDMHTDTRKYDKYIHNVYIYKTKELRLWFDHKQIVH